MEKIPAPVLVFKRYHTGVPGATGSAASVTAKKFEKMLEMVNVQG